MIIVNEQNSLAVMVERCGIGRCGKILSTMYGGHSKILCEFESESECERAFLDVLKSYAEGQKVYYLDKRGNANEQE